MIDLWGMKWHLLACFWVSFYMLHRLGEVLALSVCYGEVSGEVWLEQTREVTPMWRKQYVTWRPNCLSVLSRYVKCRPLSSPAHWQLLISPTHALLLSPLVQTSSRVSALPAVLTPSLPHTPFCSEYSTWLWVAAGREKRKQTEERRNAKRGRGENWKGKLRREIGTCREM